MTVLFDGVRAFFTERGSLHTDKLILHLPRGAALLCNGIGFYADGGAIHIPRSALHEGENRLHLRINNRLFPCEGITVTDGIATPQGLPTEEILLSLCKKIETQREALEGLSERVAALEQKNKAKMLFT